MPAMSGASPSIRKIRIQYATINTPKDSGAFKSTNGGVSWRAFSILPNVHVYSLAFNPRDPATLFAGGFNEILKNTDGGGSWKRVWTFLGLRAILCFAFDPHDPETLYAGTETGGVFWSTNGGDGWAAINTGLTNNNIHALAIGAQEPETVYLGTDTEGVFVSVPVARSTLDLPSGGAVSTSTLGLSDDLAVGYATVTVEGGGAPYGTAVFSYMQNGIVVSEAGVSVSPPARAARFFVDSRTGVIARTGGGTITTSTGLAAANQGNADASLLLKLRDAFGKTVAGGMLLLPRGAHVAKFLDQLAPDFMMPPSFVFNGLGSLEITSDQPVSVLALRLTINQRGDLLMTTTPIADLGKPAVAGMLSFPQIADGAGYQEEVLPVG